jgi:ParB-like chromosome segregation protein Spo0J
MDASSFRLLDPNLLTESAYSDRVPGDLDALVADVEARGVLRSALVGIDGKVIGGWHRRLACQRLGRDFRQLSFPGSKRPTNGCWSPATTT